jgi:uncharacterized protein YqjF (DUF2071 family)
MGPDRDERTVMRQDWHDLLFVHWSVSGSALRPLVPPALELDTFGGRAYVGLVPFGMRGVRPSWAPALPGVSDFLEVNVRTYVRHPSGGPGVWFFSLDAANRLAVLAARALWHLPYHHATMSLSRDPVGGAIAYRSARRPPGPRPAGCAVRYRPLGEPSPCEPGTLDHFLIERYVLYCRRGGRLERGQVRHEPYPAQPAEVLSLEETLLAASGVPRPDEPPLAHYARGVRVRIGPLRPCGRAGVAPGAASRAAAS